MNGVVHGGLRPVELGALGIDPVDVLDLSANLHPFGPHPHVVQAAREADLRHYPEAHTESLQAAIAARAGLDAAQVLVTAGATDAIHLAARALLRPGGACALWPPPVGTRCRACGWATSPIPRRVSRKSPRCSRRGP